METTRGGGTPARPDQATADGAADEAHADEAHADEAHADEAHADEAHADEANADEAHADEANADEANADEANEEPATGDAAADAASPEAPPAPAQVGLNRPPLLASEALMEDLAPMEPARGAARLWCAAIGLVFLVLGSLSVAGVRPGGGAAGATAFVLGALTLLLALTRITYRQRAAGMVGLGALATLLGLAGTGPAVGIDVGGAGWSAARAVAGAALPAALAFRGRYRAYAGARWLLGGAFAAALPFLAFVAYRLATHAIGLGEAGAILVILAMTAGLLGFMGAETTSAGAWLALAVNLTLATDLALAGLSALSPITAGSAAMVITAATAFAASSALTAIGLFQILAWRLAPAARRIDLHPPPKDSSKRSASKDQSDWLT